jgi:hypothetical protein
MLRTADTLRYDSLPAAAASVAVLGAGHWLAVLPVLRADLGDRGAMAFGPGSG